MRRTAALLALTLAAAACTKPAPPPPKPAALAFDTGVPLNEVMAHVVEPAAEKFWRGSGTLYDKSGLHDFTPTTPEGWKAVEDGAVGVIEASNLLSIPGRVRAPGTDWARHVAELNAIGKEALASAEKHDVKAMMLVGSRMDVVCDSCHEAFMTPEQRGEPPAKGAKAKPGAT